MATGTDDFALCNQMRVELQKFLRVGTPKSPSAIESIFDTILRSAKTPAEWYHEDVSSVYLMAGGVFINGDDKIQAMTFDFMRNLIDIFDYERSSNLNGLSRFTTKKLLRFYFHVVLRYSNKPTLFTKASQHAEERVRENHPHRPIALEAFEMSWFADYPIERFEKKAVKNLLIIAKEKMLCHSDNDPLMPGTIRFIDRVCEHQSSCGVVIRVCHVLRDLFQNLVWSQAHHKFDMLQGSPTFRWILRHTDPSRIKKKCWLAIAQFLEATFMFANGATKRLLVEMRVFPRINEMLRDRSSNVMMGLIDAVGAACKDFPFICHLVTNNIFLRILPIVEDGSVPMNVREKACEVFTRFLRNAPNYEVFRAAENGVVAAVVKLLRSKQPLAVANGLIWMRMMVEECQFEPMATGFSFLVVASGGDEILRRACIHQNPKIRDPAQEIFRRLRAHTERTHPDVAEIRSLHGGDGSLPPELRLTSL